MQKTVYYCDHCNKIIGTNFHISLCLNKGMSGISCPPLTNPEDIYPNDKWTVVQVPSGFIHFHVVCVGKYFEKMAQAVIKKSFPESFAKKKK